jgi:hypothetical protein
VVGGNTFIFFFLIGIRVLPIPVASLDLLSDGRRLLKVEIIGINFAAPDVSRNASGIALKSHQMQPCECC